MKITVGDSIKLKLIKETGVVKKITDNYLEVLFGKRSWIFGFNQVEGNIEL